MSAIISKRSAGILLYRFSAENKLEVFLVHMGGPYWANKDAHAWSIPKGEFALDESALEAAKREFLEETNAVVSGDFAELKPVKQIGGKVVFAFAVEGDCDPKSISSNRFTMEWPPNSGKQQDFPEVDKADWFSISRAREKMIKGQESLLDELLSLLSK